MLLIFSDIHVLASGIRPLPNVRGHITPREFCLIHTELTRQTRGSDVIRPVM
jgi:hypothetical protein